MLSNSEIVASMFEERLIKAPGGRSNADESTRISVSNLFVVRATTNFLRSSFEINGSRFVGYLRT